MDILAEDCLKTIDITATNLNEVEFRIEVDERYFEKGDEFKDQKSGLEFVVIDRPYYTLMGKWELRVKILTRISSLKYLRNKLTAWAYEGTEV